MPGRVRGGGQTGAQGPCAPLPPGPIWSVLVLGQIHHADDGGGGGGGDVPVVPQGLQPGFLGGAARGA